MRIRRVPNIAAQCVSGMAAANLRQCITALKLFFLNEGEEVLILRIVGAGIAGTVGKVLHRLGGLIDRLKRSRSRDTAAGTRHALQQ